MNESQQTPATSQPSQSALPDTWIERIFDYMSAMYGSKFASLWHGTDAAKVKSVWGMKLAGFADKPKAIKLALDELDYHPFPPTLPEFVVMCRDAAKTLGNDKPALPYKPTAEEVAHQREMSRRMGDAIGAGKLKDGIDAHWATHPRSAMQLGMIFDATKRDQRFQPCIAQMVADGICTEYGKLLKAYRGMNQWEAA